MEVAVYCGQTWSWTGRRICDAYQGEKLNFNTVLKWLESRKGKESESFLIFGTDVVPYPVYNYPKRPIDATPLFQFIKNGGTVIWAGDVPFYYLDRSGIRAETFKSSNPFPFALVNLANAPYSTNAEPSIVGHMLGYSHRESWRPVEPHPDLIPISYVEPLDRKSETPKLYSSWIYPYGKGRFVRVFDSPSIDPEFVLSLPRRLSELGHGVRIKNFRRFKDLKLVLPKETKVAVLLGDNDSGKTTVLEALAVLSREAEKVKEFRGELGAVNSEVEVFINGKYYYCRFSEDSKNCTSHLDGTLVYSKKEEFLTDAKGLSDYVISEASRLFEVFHKDVMLVFLGPSNTVKVALKDKTIIPATLLGSGYRSVLNFVLTHLVKKPRVLMIDDLEGFALHPELLKKFYDFLLKLDLDLVLITTQSSDVYAYLAERKLDQVKFVLLCGDDKYEIFRSEEVADMLYYEDLRYAALECGSRGSGEQS
ncbi:MAG: AAA family ATPase [Thermoprotei archaeon]